MPSAYFLSGIPPNPTVTKQDQLDAIAEQMAQLFAMPKLKVDSWGDLFWHLAKQLPEGPVVLALDEISWMGSKDRGFLGHLKNAWDLHFSKNPQLILIVCGSVSSWIEKNLLSSTGFVGRISMDMQLGELPLRDAAQFWSAHRQRLSPYEMLKVLSVTGGVPRYLEEVNSRHHAEDNIRELCFVPAGLLFREFDQVFSDLFSTKAPRYVEILQVLSGAPATLDGIASQVGFEKGGTLSDHLKTLICAGFVASDPTWNLHSTQYSNLRKYRLSDNYTRFYLRYVQPNKEKIARGMFESVSLDRLPGWSSIMGLQFENLVLNNMDRIFEQLRISPSDVVATGPFFQRPTKRRRGCQVDLLIQTRFQTLFLCEIKFSVERIGVNVVDEMVRKERELSKPRSHSTRLVLIHVNGVTSGVNESPHLHCVIDFTSLI